MKLLLSLIAVAVVTYTFFSIARIARLLRISSALVSAARSYTNSNGAFTILVLGDSTAVGVGVSTPAESVAGRLSSLLDARIENYAKSGAVVAELEQQLSYAMRERYDLVLIQAGGNDIIKLHPLHESNRKMDRALSAIGKKSDRIALLTAGRLGYAPFFPKPIAPLMTARSLFLRSLFTSTAQKHNALYVDLLGMSSVFDTDPGRYYAADMLHLTGSGYGVWFEKLETELRARWPEMFTA